MLLASAALAAAAMLMALGSTLAFYIDDWNLLLHRTGSFADVVLEPYNSHPVMSLVGVYRLLQTTVGMDSIVPFFAVSTLAFVASAVVLYVWLRGRVGEWLALAGAIVVLFLGSAYEDLLITLQLCFFVAVGCGIGAYLALERERPRADTLACGLLVVGLSFSGVTLAFLVGAAVAIALGPRPLRRLWVVAVPVALFGLWYLGWGRDDATDNLASNLAAAPTFVLDGLASSVSSMLGLTAPRADLELTPLAWGRPLLVAAAIAALAVAVRRRRPSRWLWVVLATLLAYWLSIAVNADPFRQASFSRYMYPGVVLLLMLAAELFRGVRPTRAVLVGVYALVALSLIGNLGALHDNYVTRHSWTPVLGGGFGALDIAADSVDPALRLNPENADFAYFDNVDAGSYLAAAAKYGSLGYSPEELAQAPESGRVAADKVLAAAHDLALTEPTGEAGAGDCATADLAATGASEVTTGPGAITIRAPGGGPVEVRMRRFATGSYPIDLGPVGDQARELRIPLDRADQPWVINLAGQGRVEVCRV